MFRILVSQRVPKHCKKVFIMTLTQQTFECLPRLTQMEMNKHHAVLLRIGHSPRMVSAVLETHSTPTEAWRWAGCGKEGLWMPSGGIIT